jgi:DNA-directed RNA polymerase subunit RPC12/RpoP
MPMPTYFVQECPTCGRRVEVRVEYLGRHVACEHCQGHFVAEDPNGVESGSVAMAGRDLLARANRLLEAVEARRSRRQSAMLPRRARA